MHIRQMEAPSQKKPKIRKNRLRALSKENQLEAQVQQWCSVMFCKRDSSYILQIRQTKVDHQLELTMHCTSVELAIMPLRAIDEETVGRVRTLLDPEHSHSMITKRLSEPGSRISNAHTMKENG